jgi:hypothetical protein
MTINELVMTDMEMKMILLELNKAKVKIRLVIWMQMTSLLKCSSKWLEEEVGCHRSFKRSLDQEGQEEEVAEAVEVDLLIWQIYLVEEEE